LGDLAVAEREGEAVMKCEDVRERMPDVAAGFSELASGENNHLANCSVCAEQLKAMRATMSLLDEWQTPEPSPYFDVRLQARLREEMAKPQKGWMQWFRRPVLAAALTVIMGIGVGIVFMRGDRAHQTDIPVTDIGPGSAVSDLETLDKNHDMYADFELLDDLDVQKDVPANPQNAD
jgi:predicted anti-sigma-YlaC factor YlaD